MSVISQRTAKRLRLEKNTKVITFLSKRQPTFTTLRLLQNLHFLQHRRVSKQERVTRRGNPVSMPIQSQVSLPHSIPIPAHPRPKPECFVPFPAHSPEVFSPCNSNKNITSAEQHDLVIGTFSTKTHDTSSFSTADNSPEKSCIMRSIRRHDLRMWTKVPGRSLLVHAVRRWH